MLGSQGISYSPRIRCVVKIQESKNQKKKKKKKDTYWVWMELQLKKKNFGYKSPSNFNAWLIFGCKFISKSNNSLISYNWCTMSLNLSECTIIISESFHKTWWLSPPVRFSLDHDDNQSMGAFIKLVKIVQLHLIEDHLFLVWKRIILKGEIETFIISVLEKDK